ncbi:MAG: alpha/beta hydrolase [Chloroflexi bacterium]|nr:alpha/beta hydrolase [Chloroflexota bacterium]
MGVDLFYEKHGSGVPVLLVHGFPLNHTIWHPVLPFLQSACEVILPDLRGHGNSPTSPLPFSMTDMAQDLLSLLDKLQIPQALLVGQSMGGYVVLEFAHLFPQRLSGLALVASHPYIDPPDKKAQRMKTIASVRQIGVAKALADYPQKLSHVPYIQDFTRPIIADTDPDTVIGSLQAMAARRDHSAVLHQTDFPTAVILGKKDQFISGEMREKLESEFVDTKFTVIGEASHMLMMEFPCELSKSLVELLY